MKQRERGIFFITIFLLIISVFYVNGVATEKENDTARLELYINSEKFDPVLDRIPFRNELIVSSSNIWLLQLKGPIYEEQRRALETLGAEIIGYVPQFAYVIRIAPSQLDALRALPYVRYIGPYHPAYKIAPSTLSELENSGKEVKVRVGLFGPAESFQASLSPDTKILISTPHSLVLSIPREIVRTLLFDDDVLSVEKYSPPTLFYWLQDGIKEYMGANYAATLGFKGAGIRVTVADSGVRYTHNAFGGPGNAQSDGRNTQIIHYNPYGTTLGDSVNHGTGTSSIIAGIQSNREGIAPEAKLIVQTVLTPTGGTSYTPTQGAIEAMRFQSTIHSNSWGSYQTDSLYTDASREGDRIIANNKHFLFFYAAGNAGQNGERTITHEAVAKNVVCVGGMLDSSTIPRSDDYYDPTPSGVSGPSAGPAADGRIKPDLVAAYLGYEAASNSGDSDYMNFGGTSGATPITAGLAALVQQAYKANRFGNNQAGKMPSAALLKALLIADAYQLDLSKATRMQQGWGQVDIEKMLQTASEHFLVNDTDTNGLATGQQKLYTIHVRPNTQELKITLVWSDRPATVTGSSPALVNDLDLSVTDPAGTRYLGNYGLMNSHYSQTGGTEDRLNNVENVFIQNPMAGTWNITIRGYNVPSGPQQFALAVSGASAGEPVLDHVTVTPASARVPTGGSQVFTATGYDASNTQIPGLTFTWAVTGGIGTVNPTSGTSTTFTSALTPGSGTITATASSGGATKIGSATVTVYSAPSASITAPIRGEVWNGTAHTIAWDITGGVPPYTVELFYSTNAGGSFSSITTLTQPQAGANTYRWTPSGINTENAKIKVAVRDIQPEFTNATSELFTIDTSAPTISISAPASGTVWGAGPHLIKYHVNENFRLAPQPVNISYTLDDGRNWTTIATNEPSTGSYNWSIPNGLNSMLARIRINATDFACNIGTGISVQFTIDTSAPELIHTPVSSGVTGSQILISATISDNYRVESAKLYVKGVGQTGFTSILMSRTAGTQRSGTWEARIPAQTMSGTLEYYLFATDGVNNQTTRVYSVTIRLISETGTISGHVRSNAGTALRGATICIYSGTELAGSATTDASGYYRVAGLIPGSYLITANKTGYLDESRPDITVTAGTVVTVDFILYPSWTGGEFGDISGTVTDEFGKNLSAVKIEIISKLNGSVVRSTSTNFNGEFFVTNLPSGDYEVRASKEGYENATGAVTVIAKKRTMIVLTLKIRSGSANGPLSMKIWDGIELWMLIMIVIITMILLGIAAFVSKKPKEERPVVSTAPTSYWPERTQSHPAPEKQPTYLYVQPSYQQPTVQASQPQQPVYFAQPPAGGELLCKRCGTSNPPWAIRCTNCNRQLG